MGQERQAHVQKYVKENFEREKRKRLISLTVVNIIIAILFSVVAWTTATNQATLTGMVIMSVGWWLTIFLQALALYLHFSKEGDRQIARQLMLQARIQHMLGGTDSEIDAILESEKPKREQAYRLSDDGELVPDDSAAVETDANIEQKQRRADH